jgi:hypothetical protein
MNAKFPAALICAGTLAVAFAPPAVGHNLNATNGCDVEHGWFPVAAAQAPQKDRNGDGSICLNEGGTYRDNHIHTNH